MVRATSIVSVSLFLVAASALPLERRIAQSISESTQKWTAACTKAGGGEKCSSIAQTAFSTLLAAPPACAQHDSADAMIDLAKTLKNDPEMIRLAQLFIQQPRNAPDSLQVPYCQKAPKNEELNGLFHCQFAGSKFPTFSGDQTGNVPFGLTVLNIPGTCPANPEGPIPDGQQINAIATDPGVGGFEDGTTDGTDGTDNSAPPAETGKADTGAAPAKADPPAPAKAEPAAPAKADPPAAAAGGFKKQNGLDAIALNKKFASIKATDSCTDGEQACVDNGFAQCVGGKWAVNGCAGGLKCFALPLVNKAGTSVTCDTEADATQRIKDTGAA